MRVAMGTANEGWIGGGAAALYLAAAYVAGIAYFLVGIDYPSVVDPLDKIALFARHLRGLQVAYLAIYVVFGFVLMVLAWALHGRLRGAAPGVMRIATSVGLVWAGLLVAGGMVTNIGMETVVALHTTDPTQAATVWRTIEAVTSGMTGGNGEVLGGLWTLLVSVAAWRGRSLPTPVIVVGMVAGASGLASALPGLTPLVAAFGLTQLVWFVGVGVVLLRREDVARSASSQALG
jgi:hypothetical protein